VRNGRHAASLLAALLLLLPAFLSAQNGVTVSDIAADGGTMTFNVRWTKPMPVTLWSDTVWVFVDYNNGGKMERLPLLPGGATLTAHSAPGNPDVGVVEIPGNNRGVWVVGNARKAGSFSATVELRTDAMHSVSAGMCAYASNYPPMADYIDATHIHFTGTPPYGLELRDGSGNTEYQTGYDDYWLQAGYTLHSFTDATGAPGTFNCTMPVITLSSPPRCGSGTLTLGVNVADAGAVTVNWYADDACTTLLQGNSATFTTPPLTTTTTYYIKAVSNSNPACTSPPLPVSATVNLYEGIIGGPVQVCAGESFTLTSGVDAVGTQPVTYTWYENGVPVGSSNRASLRIPSGREAGTYAYVRMAANDDCVQPSNTCTVEVLAPAAAGQAIDPVCGCASGLEACDGTCEKRCCPFTACSGFTKMTCIQSEIYVYTLEEANARCTSKGEGWRLPTLTELQCMCANKDSLPGGYDAAVVFYWNSDTNDDERKSVRFNDCWTRTYPFEMAVFCVK
jgi:hypothetical protein